MVDPWSWTLDYLELMNAKVRGTLVPPCPHLPRFVHYAPSVKTGWTDEQKARQSTLMAEKAQQAKTTLVRVHQARQAHPDLTQKELGIMLNMSQPVVSKLLRTECTSA